MIVAVTVEFAGVIVTSAEPDLDGSAELAAVILIVCALDSAAGAVYSPAAVSVPSAGFMLQKTAVLAEPATSAANCMEPPLKTAAAPGAAET